eukprot:SAG31_NODE_4738_length_2989_cov_1.405882_1_plen_168_part_10
MTDTIEGLVVLKENPSGFSDEPDVEHEPDEPDVEHEPDEPDVEHEPDEPDVEHDSGRGCCRCCGPVSLSKLREQLVLMNKQIAEEQRQLLEEEDRLRNEFALEQIHVCAIAKDSEEDAEDSAGNTPKWDWEKGNPTAAALFAAKTLTSGLGNVGKNLAVVRDRLDAVR